nr:SH3 domain-containing protein [Oscillospiraceae bacterium]
VIIFLMFRMMFSIINRDSKEVESVNNNANISNNIVITTSQNITTITEKITETSPKIAVATITSELFVETNVVTIAEPSSELIVTEPAFSPYLYSIKNEHLPIFSDIGYDSDIVDYITDKGTYTIVKQSGSWGKLKSGLGWINLDDGLSENSDEVDDSDVFPWNVGINNYCVPVFSEAGYDSDIVDYITDKRACNIIEISGNWAKLESGSGWINFDDIWSEGNMEYIGLGAVCTDSEFIDVYYGPNSNSEIFFTADKDSIVDVYAIDVDGWYCICQNTSYGFVSSEYIKVFEESKNNF